MMVRPGKVMPAHKARGGKQTPKPIDETFTFPAPIRGLILNENLATPGPGGASILDNWICTTTGIRARGGAKKHATLAGDVRSLFSYKSGSTEKFFGADGTAIYDITAPVDAAVAPSAAVSGQTAGYYSTEQFGTAGGNFLYAVNGADKARLFDGTTWTAIDGLSTPAITGVATPTFSHVWSFANRLFFVQKGTKSAWYLPVDSIGGAASEFSLAGIFRQGGSLLFGATWSLDAGDGLDDKCVFVSTEGEVAVYEGTNPGSAADWRKVGVYQITRPLGQNGIMQAGGDLLIATEAGLVSISQAIRRDVAALSMGAVSAPIAPLWQSQAENLVGRQWEIMKWPQRNIMIVSQPDVEADTGSCLVANLQTGAWSRITGWVTRCLGFFGGRGYFGSANGAVYQMDIGGNDDGAVYTCAYLGLHDDMGLPGRQKTATQMRAIFQSATPINPRVSAQVDFGREIGPPPSSPPDFTVGLWDIGKWDQAAWDVYPIKENLGNWSSVGRTGYTIAPSVQLTFGTTGPPLTELVSINATFRVGAMVT